MTKDTLEAKRKRLLVRSHRRGMHENDFILGKFADEFIWSLDEKLLDQYEELLEELDPDLLEWFMDRKPTPQKFQNEIMALIRKFNKLD